MTVQQRVADLDVSDLHQLLEEHSERSHQPGIYIQFCYLKRYISVQNVGVKLPVSCIVHIIEYFIYIERSIEIDTQMYISFKDSMNLAKNDTSENLYNMS